jgi:hypothetical protein
MLSAFTVRRLLAVVLLVASARGAEAQSAPGTNVRPPASAPTAPRTTSANSITNLRLLAIGNFIGQFDGFCEPPGGAYDLALSGQVTPCRPGGPGGNAPANGGADASTDDSWPAALGGLIGAENWIKAHPGDQGRPARLLLQGNNQTPDFADYLSKDHGRQKDAAIAPVEQYRAAVTQTKRDTVRRRQQRAEAASQTFWDRVAQLKPAAIALGPDDFYRSLRLSADTRDAMVPIETDTAASRFVAWVREKRDELELLASNAIVSVAGKELNDVDSADSRYALKLDDRSSIGWLKQFTVEHPCGTIPTFTLESSPDGKSSWRDVPIAVAAPPPPAVDCQTTLKVSKGALQPGKYFRVSKRAGAAGTTDVIALFRTHAALTPAGSAVPGLEGWPARLVPLNGMDATRTSQSTGTSVAADEMLIVSLVSQTTRETLGNPVWTWRATPAGGGASTLPAVCASGAHKTSCRLDFMPPADALSAILEQVLTVRDRLPFIVLLSMMDDDDTLDVMERFPEIRVVVLPPDSLLLGRASRATPVGAKDSLEARLAGQGKPTTPLPDFSGDLGMFGIVDADKASVARVLMRPEWVGETIADVGLQVRYESDDRLGSRWMVRAPEPERTNVFTVPGVPLVAAAGPAVNGFATTEYWPLGHETTLKTKPYVTHLACVEGDARPMCKAFKDVWTDAPTLLAVAADALRTRSHADLVVVPEDLADTDAVDWIDHALSSGDTSWLSAYTLQRVTFRPYRFVRTTVGGDKLLGMLQRVLRDPLGNGSSYCIAGLGDDLGCPSKLPDDRLERTRVNGRVIRPGFFYTVTMPDRLAEKETLPHSDDREDGFDAIDALQRHLNPLESEKQPGDAGAWYPDGWKDDTEGPPSMIARLESKATQQPKHYINVSEFEFGLISLDARAPGEKREIPNNVDFDVRGARTYSSRSITIKADSVAADFKRQAIRGIFELEYATRKELDNKVVAYDRDRLLYGPRVDLWKVRTLGDLRPYVGFFVEGPLREHQSELRASRSLGTVTRSDGSTVTQSESAGFTTTFTVIENPYKYAALGADVVVASAAFRGIPRVEASLSRLKLEWARGEASHVPLDFVVDADGGGPVPGVNLTAIKAACPDKNASTRSGDAGALLSAFFTCQPDGLVPDSRVELVTGKRSQDRTQFELEGAVAIKAKGRTYKVTLSNQLRYFTVSRAATDPPTLDLAIERTNRFKVQFTVPLIWRLEFAPTYEYQYARIQAGDVFRVKRWDVKLKLPLFFGLSRPPFAG